jgi:glioma pathogenesis-related protein 2
MNAKQIKTLALASLASLATITSIGIFTSDVTQAQTAIDLTTFRNTTLSQHNTYRTTHRSPSLTSSASLNASAQRWAEQMASSGSFRHSSASQRNNAGENLYVSYTTANSVAAATLANQAMTAWYNEVSAYNYANPVFSMQTGHFTQLVWRSSTQLGCGSARGTATLSGRTYNAFYVVCHYSPAGNVTGQFAQNVQRP